MSQLHISPAGFAASPPLLAFPPGLPAGGSCPDSHNGVATGFMAATVATFLACCTGDLACCIQPQEKKRKPGKISLFKGLKIRFWNFVGFFGIFFSILMHVLSLLHF
jgi:hypothetical protein